MGGRILHRRTILAAAVAAPAAAVAFGTPAVATSNAFPSVINLPNGWRPEGIAVGAGARFYVGSLADGAIYRGSLLSGQGSVFVAGSPGTQKVGLEIDQRHRIWACGGGGGGGSVYSEFSGELLASYTFGGTFVNDAAAARSGVYFTDSQSTVLYAVPFGRHGKLPGQEAVRTIALPPGLGDAGAGNNGIVSTSDGRLIVVQSNADRLYTFDPETGTAVQIDTGGASVLRGDGLLLLGHTLYVVRNRLNIIAKFKLNHELTTATLLEEITSPDLDVPATIGAFGPYLYAANARFTTPPGPDVAYWVTRVRG
jgi:sugar lactone lactonase YvrE